MFFFDARANVFVAMVLFSTALLISSAASACTGIQLAGENGAVVRGRTMEWGKFDMQTTAAVFPRKTLFQSTTPDGKNGLSWKSTYGFAGLQVLDKAIADGMNEKGLSGGMFYHKGFAEYAEYEPASADKSLNPIDVLNFILSNFSTVEEVREGLKNVRVVKVVDANFGFPVPIHVMLTEPTGDSLVIEYKDGVPNFFDNPVGVITNNPTFDWHLTNLRNYGFLSDKPYETKQWGQMEIAPLAGGSGMLGIPGDFTSPSRFVRAAVFTQYARTTKGGLDTTQELFRILDNFNEGMHQAEGSDRAEKKLSLPSATQWTIANDTENLIIYYHTMYNRRVRKIDLNMIDFTNAKMFSVPMDDGRKQDIEDITEKLH